MSGTDALQKTLDAEAGVIGSMLRSEQLVPVILAAVDPADFSSAEARLIFDAARDLFRAGKPVDAMTIRNVVGAEHTQTLLSLLENTPTAANWSAYAEDMHEQAAMRRIRESAETLLSAPTLEACREPVAALGELFAAGRKVDAWTMDELLRDFMSRQGNKEPREYVTFGIDRLDEGLYSQRGDVVMVCGSPSDGKTALALTLAYHIALRYNVGFFSLETGKEKLEDRLVASGIGIDFGRIKRGELTEDDWTTFARDMGPASQRRLTVVRSAGMTAEQIAGISRARGFDVIFIDYVQLVTPVAVRGASRAEQMAEVSRTLHTFAQTAGVMVVELAQLRRPEKVKPGAKSRPQEVDMHDIGESSQFERDADVILLLTRPYEGEHLIRDDADSTPLDPDRHRILRVAKNKEGRRVRVVLDFDGAHQRFAVLTQDPSKLAMRHYAAAGNRVRDRNGFDGQTKMHDTADVGDMPF